MNHRVEPPSDPISDNPYSLSLRPVVDPIELGRKDKVPYILVVYPAGKDCIEGLKAEEQKYIRWVSDLVVDLLAEDLD